MLEARHIADGALIDGVRRQWRARSGRKLVEMTYARWRRLCVDRAAPGEPDLKWVWTSVLLLVAALVTSSTGTVSAWQVHRR